MSEERKILLIDDDDLVRESMRMMLSREGYKIIQASDGEEGLKKARRYKPSLILLDVKLVGRSGFEIIKDIKADPELSDCFVVFVSGALVSPEDQANGLDLGAAGYILKPFKRIEFVSKINTYFRLIESEKRLKNNERELREKEELLRLTLDNAHTGIITFYKNKRIRTVNKAFCDMLGYTGEELLVKSILDITIVDDHKEIRKVFNDLWSERSDHVIIENSCLHKDGSIVYTKSRLAHAKDESGKPAFGIGEIENITEKKQAESELKKVEFFNESIINSSSDSIIVLDRDFRIIFMSKGSLEIFDIDEVENYLGMYYPEFWEGTKFENSVRNVFELAEKKQTGNFQGFLPTAKGLPKWWDINVNPILGEDGRVNQFLVTSRDVTRLKTQEIEIDFQRERLQSIIGNIPVMIINYNQDFKVFLANLEFQENLGWTNEEISENRLFKLCLPDPEVRMKALEFMRQGLPGWNEFDLTKKDGTVIRTMWSNIRLSDDTYIGIGVDITEKKIAEDALRRSEKRFKTLIENSPVAIAISKKGKVEYANRVCTDLFEFKDHEAILGTNVFDYLLDENTERLKEINRKRERGLEGPKSYEFTGVTKTGKKFPYELRVATIETEEEGHASIGFLNDITERKKFEDKINWESGVNRAVAALSQKLLTNFENINIITNVVLEQAKIITGSKYGFVSTIDEVTGDNVCHTLSEMIKDNCTVDSKRQYVTFPRGADGTYAGLWGHALNTKKSFYSNSPDKHDASKGIPEGHVKIKKFLNVPVIINDEIAGQIALANPDRDYVDRDIVSIEMLGEIYALAILRMRSLGDLNERIKELNGLYGLGKLTETKDNIDDLLDTFVREIVPESLQFPDKAVTELKIDKTVFRNRDDRIVSHLESDIVVRGRKRGILKIGYNEELPFIGEFEQKLVDGYSERLGKIIDRLDAEEDLKNAYDYLEDKVKQRTNELAEKNLELEKEIEVRIKSEEALIKSEHKYRNFIESSHDFIYSKDLEGRYISLNNKTATALGGTCKEDILGKTDFDLLSVEYAEALRKVDLQVMESGKDLEVEEIFTHNNKEIYLISHKWPLYDDKGNIAGINGFSLDITDRKKAHIEREASEAKYKDLYDGMTDGVAAVDMDGKIIEFNSAFKNLIGYEDAEIYDLSYEDITPSEYHEMEAGLITDQVLIKGYSDYYQKEYITKKGIRIPIELRTYLIRDNYGNPERIWAIIRDISERKKAEKIIQEARDRAQNYLDIVGVMLVALDKVANVTLVNNKGCEILGYEENEILGKNWFDNFLGLDNINEVKDIFSQIMDGKIESFRYVESFVIKKSGERRDIAWYNTLLRDESGQIVGTLSSGEDITERKKAQQDLMNERAKLEIMLKHESLIANITSQFNESTSYDDVLDRVKVMISMVMNINFVNIFFLDENESCIVNMGSGTELDGQAGNSEYRINYEDLPPEFFQSVNRNKPIIYRGKDSICNILFPGKDQLRSAVLVPMKIDENTNGIICFGQKSDKPWAREKIELCQTIADIINGAWKRHVLTHAKIIAERKHTKAVQTAEEALRLASIGALAAGITHEINQPLNALSMAVNGILYWSNQNRAIPIDEVYKKLEFISRQAARIDEIILQMRVLAKQEDASEPVIFDINKSIEESLLLINQRLKAHQIEIVTDLSEDPILITGSPIQIEQIILNLVSNAMNALDTISKNDKSIKLKTNLIDDSCEITVLDNGPGIPEETLENIFDPFVSTRIKGESMGFGLSIAQRITIEHGGKISAHNNDSGGAKFIINLPSNKQS